MGSRVLCGRKVWPQIVADHLTGDPPDSLSIAVAYLGSTALEVLEPRRGARLLVDGSDLALKAGATAPAALQAWHQAGALVRSLTSLHAKTVIVDSSPALAVVGSMNLSANSAWRLHEAAIVTDDQNVVAGLRAQFEVWWTQADTVDDAWIRRASRIYAPARLPRDAEHATEDADDAEDAAERMPLIDPSAPMWVSLGMGKAPKTSHAAEAALEQAVLDYGQAMVDVWPVLREDVGRVMPGQTVVMARPRGQRLQINTPVGPPAVVLEVFDEPGSLPEVLLAWDSALPTARRDAVDQATAGHDFHSEHRVVDPDVKAQVLGLWPDLKARTPQPAAWRQTRFVVCGTEIDLERLYAAMLDRAEPDPNNGNNWHFVGRGRGRVSTRRLISDLFGAPPPGTKDVLGRSIRDECIDRLAELGWAHRAEGKTDTYGLTREATWRDLNESTEYATVPALVAAVCEYTNGAAEATDEAVLIRDLETWLELELDDVWADWTDDGHGQDVLVIASDSVVMWTLPFPTTGAQFRQYINELERRVHRHRLIELIPTADEWNDPGCDSTAEGALATLFGVGVSEVTARLGENLIPFDADAVGMRSHPDRYLLWDEQHVIGLDDQSVNLYRMPADDRELDVSDLIDSVDLGTNGTISFAEFADFLNASVANEPGGSPQ